MSNVTSFKIRTDIVGYCIDVFKWCYTCWNSEMTMNLLSRNFCYLHLVSNISWTSYGFCHRVKFSAVWRLCYLDRHKDGCQKPWLWPVINFLCKISMLLLISNELILLLKFKCICCFITFCLKVIYKGFFKSFIVLYANRICPEHHFVENRIENFPSV